MVYASALELYMLELVNEERASRDLSLLKLETNLNLSAEDHSVWMLDTGTFSHTGVGGSSAKDRIVAADFDLVAPWGTAENIAVQSERGEAGYFDDVADLHTSLMNSEGHRANLLNPDLEYIGIGIEIGSFTYSSSFTANSVIVTQNFARTVGTVDLDDLNGGAGAVVEEPATVEAAPAEETRVETEVEEVEPDGAPGFVATSGADSFEGTEADDKVKSVAGNDSIAGGAGNDTLTGGSGDDTLHGGDDEDRVWGEDGDDLGFGGAGHDVVAGMNGSDTLWGGNGNDSVYGGTGDDTLGGAAGFDSLTGNGGVDLIWGGDQNDTIEGGTGDDSLFGGSHSDLISGDEGDDLVNGGWGWDSLYGGDGADFLDGFNGNDLMDGGRGDDIFLGGAGNDTISGGSGNDTIYGGWGDDHISGGAGADRFVFGLQPGSDVITDFNADEGDVLRLDDVLWLDTHGALSKTAVIDTFGTVSNGTLTLTFDEGEVLVLNDVTSLEDGLAIF